MNEQPTVSPSPEFKDRRGGLIGFGVVLLVVGCICALFVPLMLLGQAMASQTTGVPTDYRMIIPGVVMYGGLAVAFSWLGIGSIMARRWARALVLILAWLWFVTGVISIGFMAAFLPRILSTQPTGGQQLPHAALVVTMVFMLGFMSVAFLVLPGLLVLFYRSPHVKATCEARDPVRRWTDACPLPVLGLSLVLGIGVVSMLPMLFAYHSVAPCFGRLVTGAPGAGIILGIIGLWSYCAWATYRLKPAGWWAAMIGFGVMMVSALLTFPQVDLIEMYRLMGYPEQQIQQIQQYNFFTGPTMTVFMTLGALPCFGYLVYVKKYFPKTA